MDPQIQAQMAQAFATNHAVLQQTATRFNDGSAFAAQQSKQGFLLQERMVGAAAINQLETNGLADLVAQLKTAQNYPPNTNVQPGGVA